jgi:hypothetical protein
MYALSSNLTFENKILDPFGLNYVTLTIVGYKSNT